jgi:hypothetical protein
MSIRTSLPQQGLKAQESLLQNNYSRAPTVAETPNDTDAARILLSMAANASELLMPVYFNAAPTSVAGGSPISCSLQKSLLASGILPADHNIPAVAGIIRKSGRERRRPVCKLDSIGPILDHLAPVWTDQLSDQNRCCHEQRTARTD